MSTRARAALIVLLASLAAGCAPCRGEACDGLDNDCDGAVDEEGEVLDRATLYYADADGDGYGDCAAEVYACSAPAGHAEVCGDCDDARSRTNPGAPEECANDRDDDCDGTDNGCRLLDDIPLDGDAAGLLGAQADDRTGTSVAWIGDLDGDGGDDLAVGAPGVDAGANNAGAVYVLTGVEEDTYGAADATAILLGDHDDDGAGTTCAGGDLDGDGVADVVVAAPYADDAANNAGAVYVVVGPMLGTMGLGAAAAAMLLGQDNGDQLGDSAGLATGDIDGDGVSDLLVGAPGYDTDLLDAGAVYLLPGPIAVLRQLADATAILTGTGTREAAGSAVAIGADVNGDGVGDLLVGAPGAGAAGGGVAWRVDGPVAGTLSLADAADAVLVGGESGADGAGLGVAFAGDLDGDGLVDVAVGARGADAGGVDAGVLYVVFGAAVGRVELADAGARLVGGAPGDGAGWQGLATGGDLDGDGAADLVVGASGADDGAVDGGAAYVAYGPIAGTVSLGDADARLVGRGLGGHAGAWIDSTGDANGDGARDIVVGAPQEPGGGTAAGAAWLVFGGAL